MAHKMDPDKSGVVIYFEPLQKVANKLDDARLGQLFRYILNFASPETETDPVIEDEILAYIWDFVRTLVIRDDKTYQKKSLMKQYAAFCRYAKENGYDKPPLSRETWTEQGAPTFSQWREAQLHTGAVQCNADVCSAVRAHTEFLHCMPTSTSASLSISDSLSQSESASDAASAEADGGPAVAGADADADASAENENFPPYEIPTLAQVKRYCKEHGLRHTSPEYYYNYYASNGWTTQNGKRVKDWRANLRNWNIRDRQRGAPEWKDEEEEEDEVAKYARQLKERREKQERS